MNQEFTRQLKLEIDHIFESGANEVRILNMVEAFIDKRFNNESSRDMLVKIDDSLIDLKYCCEITPVVVEGIKNMKINIISFEVRLINQDPIECSIRSNWWEENGEERELQLIKDMEAKRNELIVLWSKTKEPVAEFMFTDN